MKKILITGGAGFVGSHLCERLLNEGNQGTVCNLNIAAELQGLFIGQSIGDTILRCPNVVVRFFDLEEDYRFLDLLSRWAGKYSPWIKKELPDGVLIDITGCAHLFGGEQGLIEAFKIDCDNFALTVHIGLADTVGAAWALSRFLENTSELLHTGDVIDQEARATRARAFKRGNQPSSLTIDQKNNELSFFKYIIAPCGQTREYISNLPLASLRLSQSKVISLRRLGFRYIKDLLEIPRAPLTRRFGRDLLTRLDQILGLEPEPVSPEKPVNRFSVRLTLPEPIGLKSDFLLALEKLVPALCRKLKNSKFGVRKLQLQIFRTDSTTQSIYIQLTQPSFDTEKILILLAMKLDEDDKIVGVKICHDDQDIMLSTKNGKCIRFECKKLRVFKGRSSKGIRGVDLASTDEIVSLSIVNKDKAKKNNKTEVSEATTKERFVLSITENGYGKKTSQLDYRVTNRGGKGIIGIINSPRNGNICSSFPVYEVDEVMISTDKGRVIRVAVKEIRTAGRNTQGVRIIKLSGDEKVVSAIKIDDNLE